LLVVAPAGVALELEPQAMHGDADLLVHLADQALDLVDPGGALLGLAPPAQTPVTRARDQEQHRGALVPAPPGRALDLRGERAAVRLGDRAVGKRFEEKPERGVAGSRAGGTGLQELEERDRQTSVARRAEQVDALDAAVRIGGPERRIGGRRPHRRAPAAKKNAAPP